LNKPERARHATSCRVAPRWPSPYTRVRKSMTACDRRSEAGSREHYAPNGADVLQTPTPVLRCCRAHANARTRARYWPELAAHRQPPPRPCHRSYGQRSSGETASKRCSANKTPPCFSLTCAREHIRLPPSAISAASELLAARDAPATPGPSLTPTQAPTTIHGLDPSHIVPEPEPRRSCRHYLAASHRPALLRPSHRHGSTPRESNRPSHPFVCVLRSHLAVRELARLCRDTDVNVEGISVKEGPVCKDLCLGFVSTKSSALQNLYKILKKSKNCKINFVVLLVPKPMSFEKLYILLSYSFCMKNRSHFYLDVLCGQFHTCS
jgi:hypothetical protein